MRTVEKNTLRNSIIPFIGCIFKLTTLCVITSFLLGCGTLGSLSLAKNIENRRDMFEKFNYYYPENRESHYIPYVYSGSKRDLLDLTVFSPSGEDALVMLPFLPFYYLFYVIDLPLSFVLDTAILPYTIYQQNNQGYIVDPPYFEIAQHQDNLKELIEYYEKGFEVLPKYYGLDYEGKIPARIIEYYIDLGRLYKKFGDCNKSKEYYSKGIELFSKYYSDNPSFHPQLLINAQRDFRQFRCVSK
jgi:tetratricopeptide (TPR) repeat protein